MWISTLDHARFGLLFLRRGFWSDRQLLSRAWVDAMTTPCDIKPEYGCLWWLNQNHYLSDIGSPLGFAAMGAGGNIVFVEPERDLVIVLRWCSDTKLIIDQILAAVTE